MPLAEIIQNLIHKLEAGAVPRFFRISALLLAVVALALCYDLHAYRNLATPEGMDAAQLARNISEGRGYTTLFIRPFSLFLVQRHNEAGKPLAPANVNFDFARVKTAHPDLANPPVYPVLLAGWMKVMPFRYPVNVKSAFWSENDSSGKSPTGRLFARYQPDFLIAVFNQILLVAVVVMTFFIARKLFDAAAAWLSAILVIGCELLWRFSASGLSTMLVLVIFLGLTWCLLRIEEMAREPQQRANRLLGLAVAAGALTGVGALTRYAFGWTIIPVVVFLVLFSGPKKVQHALAALGAFVLMLTPWVIRNFAVSGTPFGTAGFAAVETTFLFPQFQLERAIHPNLGHLPWLTPYLHKLAGNGQDILTNNLPRFGGSWATLLFWAGLLLSFRSVAVRRMRYFLLFCLGTFVVVQALGQTQLSVESPEVNSENLLVLLAPLAFIYGVGLFLTLLDQMNLPVLQLRYPIIAAFLALTCLPMILVMLPPKTVPVAYPPYYPPDIQQTAGWMKENELMMSDVPWAVAWYGQRQCVWLSLNTQDDFDAINYWVKPVQALYLTPETMDSRFVSDWVRTRNYSWGSFILQVVTQNQIPPQFPLRIAPTGYLPERLFLTDRERWKLAPQ
jgi:4-amino-4-deoxy-L-arabinose transferase-like glycosyltransferase